MSNVNLALEPNEMTLAKPNNVNLRGSFMVNVTAVSDPGKFYVLPYYKLEAMNLNCMHPLQKLAPNSSLPVEILPNQMYAVLNSDRKWSKAFVGPPTGNFQVKKLEFLIYKHVYHLIFFSGWRRACGNALRVLSS